MKRIYKKVIVFGIGGVSYGICEIIWRGFTHPSMLLLGGLCFILLYEIEEKYRSVPLTVRCISGGIIITSLELITGCIVNKVLGMQVWDYSDMPFNLYGQICLNFSLIWVIMCPPAFFLCRIIMSEFCKKCINQKVFLPKAE